VRAALRERGVAEELVDSALQGLDWAAAALEARVKKFGPVIPAEFADRAKQMRFLQYRGFGSDEIRHALAGDWDQD
jgi:regulatory protein